jgi:hypothetical protein
MLNDYKSGLPDFLLTFVTLLLSCRLIPSSKLTDLKSCVITSYITTLTSYWGKMYHGKRQFVFSTTPKDSIIFLLKTLPSMLIIFQIWLNKALQDKSGLLLLNKTKLPLNIHLIRSSRNILPKLNYKTGQIYKLLA